MVLFMKPNTFVSSFPLELLRSEFIQKIRESQDSRIPDNLRNHGILKSSVAWPFIVLVVREFGTPTAFVTLSKLLAKGKLQYN